MAGFLDFLKGLGGAGQATPAIAASGPGSAADPFKPLPTLNQGFLSGLDPSKVGQAGAGLRDAQDPTQAQDPALQQLLQQHAQHQALIAQLLGGR